ncbi:DUF488 domain-containing protein [Roseovarius spongiae]
MARFATIGHSNRAPFVQMLRDAGVGVLADVRSFPRSRSNPAFNIDALPETLAPYQIGYAHFPDLGGRRNKQPEVSEDLNAMWRVRSFHNYADYALSEPFGDALDRLIALGERATPCLMCAEAVWWRCHRRIVTDYLLARGHEVENLMAEGRSEPARMTPGARATDDGRVLYPPEAE